MGAGSPRPLANSVEPGPGLLDLLEEGFHPLFFRFFYVNELPNLRLVCKAFTRCLGPEQAAAALRQMRGLAFPAQWPGGTSRSVEPSTLSSRLQRTGKEWKPPVRSSDTSHASSLGSGAELCPPASAGAAARFSANYRGEHLPEVAPPGDFNLLSHFVNLRPPPTQLSELSLYWDQSVHAAEVLLPLFNKLLMVSESIQTLSVQTRTAAWSAPADIQWLSMVFPRVKRLRIHHSFLRRAGPNDTFYGDLAFPPGPYRRPFYLQRGELGRTLQPRPQLLSRCVFPACEDLEYFELCENERTQGVELVPFIRGRELHTIIHLFSVMAPAVRRATVTLCCFKALPFAVQGILDSMAHEQTDATSRNISTSSQSRSFCRASEDSAFPGSSLEELQVIQSLPACFVEDDDVEDTELEAAFPGVRTAGHRGSSGDTARDRQFRKVLRNLKILRLVVQDDDMKDVFDFAVLPILRHLCPAVQPVYEGTATLPLEVAGRALHLRIPSGQHSLLTKRSHVNRRDRYGRNRYPGRGGPLADASQEYLGSFDANVDGVSAGVVEMLRDWVTRPEWMEIGVWKHILERPPRLHFASSWWHANVVAACAEALGFADVGRDTGSESQLHCSASCSSQRPATGHRRANLRNAEPSAPCEEANFLPPQKRNLHTFVLPTVTVHRMLWDYDARAFEALVAAVPHFVLAIDSHSAALLSRWPGPVPNLLGLQIDLCKWGKIRLCRQHITAAKTHARHTRFLRLLDSNRLEYKPVDSATKEAVDSFVNDLLTVCPHTQVIEYRRVSVEYTWQMEGGVSGDTPPFSVDKLCSKGFHVKKTLHVPSCGGNLLPSSCNASIISILFVRRKPSV
ncbi:hypothetical protein TGRUB_314110 [Toxoplasma gondii RUB]|uniref:Uncharacterized protein n=2 Tax=Toxoplasma gondii TaxID=5811 RepID=A0A086MBD4_TOXGO|nr:hypothetical protein TGRUB_314110 [Toxoplasma gondii RUB]RQX72800.1 hypothetical protein TGCAST_314110 [Toxoplasma gondii CAST]